MLKNIVYLSNKLIFLLAVAGGLSVANLYYNQPLLAEIARSFNTTSQAVSLISTLTQLGYACGIFLFVPIGDIREKKQLMLILICAVAVALLGVATATSLIWMYIASFAVGLTTVAPQIITPLVAQLSKPEEKGRAVGFVVSGLLLGILLARTIAGYIGYILGWRYMFELASVLMCLLALVLYYSLPTTPANEKLTYRELLRSVFSIISKYSMLRRVSISGAMLFGAFSAFWTTLTFLLENPPYYMQSDQIGLFGLLGAAGALGVSFVGRLNDNRDPHRVAIKCISIGLFSFFVLYFWRYELWGIIMGVVLLDFGIQGAQVSNQTRIYTLSSNEKSRINTVFVVSNFIGAAVGSLLGALAWKWFNWPGVCVIGIVMLLIALVITLLERE